MTRRSAQRVSGFWWQGLLIVLPTVVLAAVGFRALRQDQRLVEQEARQRAAEIARSISGQFGPGMVAEFSKFEMIDSLWFGAGGEAGEVRWPGRSHLTPAVWAMCRQRLSEWLPGVRPVDVFPLEAKLSETGRLEWPPDYPQVPSPAPWLDELSTEQRALWDKATAIRFQDPDAATLKLALDEFLSLSPSTSAKAVANFALLTLSLRSNTPAERMTRLLKFARVSGAEVTESGLPIKTVVLAQALRDAAETGLTEELFDALADWKNGGFGSVLTSRLLAQVESLAVRESPAVREAVSELGQRWEGSERLLGLARRAQEILQPQTFVTTNFWLNWSDRRWFVIADTNDVTSPTLANGQPTNGALRRATRLLFFPDIVVQRAAELAARKLDVTLPRYCGLRVSLEREVVWNSESGHSLQPMMIIGQSEGHLSPPAMPSWGRNADGLPELGVEFASWRSHPSLSVEIVLARVPLLYAYARQRAFIFGATILSASLAALAGWVMARRAFIRQLRLNELKSNFVSSVSHELRAPIASVRLLAEGLESGRIQDERKKRDYFKFIVQECRRLTALIENVLDFSRIEQGRKQYEFEPTDLAALTQHTVKLMETYAAERGVTLELKLNDTQLPDSPKWPATAPQSEDESGSDSTSNSQLLGPPKPSDGGSTLNSQPSLDGRAIQQALVNLIDNALKHSPKGSMVTVGLDFLPARKAESKIANPASRFTPHVSRVQLWVEDHGPGIPPEEHERIFERFYRLGSELRRETLGVGIGLSIVKHIVEAHGGKVTVRSAVGQGSRFTIELPVADTPSQ